MIMDKNHSSGMKSNINHSAVMDSNRNLSIGIILTTQWSQIKNHSSGIVLTTELN